MPPWYGISYPTLDDLLALADGLGKVVLEDATPVAYTDGRAIVLPIGLGPLHKSWSLAHELGHSIHHAGPSKGGRSKQEAQANRWASCALIPEARIRHHANACEDAFIAALSAHYEDLPMEDCSARRLAARIARYRIEALEKEVPHV